MSPTAIHCEPCVNGYYLSRTNAQAQVRISVDRAARPAPKSASGQPVASKTIAKMTHGMISANVKMSAERDAPFRLTLWAIVAIQNMGT